MHCKCRMICVRNAMHLSFHGFIPKKDDKKGRRRTHEKTICDLLKQRTVLINWRQCSASGVVSIRTKDQKGYWHL